METARGIVGKLGTIFELGKAVDEAMSTARRNEAKCEELAQRAKRVAEVLRQKAAATTELVRLRRAHDDALKLIKSYRLIVRGSLFFRLVRSDELAAKFKDINDRITHCLADLNAADVARLEKKLAQLAALENNSQRKITAGNGSRKKKKIDSPHQCCTNYSRPRGYSSQKKINVIAAPNKVERPRGYSFKMNAGCPWQQVWMKQGRAS